MVGSAWQIRTNGGASAHKTLVLVVLLRIHSEKSIGFRLRWGPAQSIVTVDAVKR
jgi:hypothetical protein